jgi:NDP-sugar pyrophosphorylase family protein
MKKILICPGERSAVAFLSQFAPLANLPLLGESVLGHWMEYLSARGTKAALVLATDRPEQVCELIGNGARWGINVQVTRELQELTPAEAREKYHAIMSEGESVAPVEGSDVILIDHLPELPEQSLFSGYAQWFATLVRWLQHTPKSQRIGVRELKPGVLVGLRTHIDPSAELNSPCWVGESVKIGPNVIIGPGAVLEDRVIVDAASEIAGSVIGPETFIGALTKVQDSIAWGNTLINWRTGSCTQVPDPFLMSPLGSTHFPHARHSALRWKDACRAAFMKPFELLQVSKAKLPH